ncbi:MAG TPA: BamA/TamA family outer membrane protein [Chitinophagales bacterium]|nr:BamA/TamA family outer membrane protein [Chitinophagales bacterium]
MTKLLTYTACLLLLLQSACTGLKHVPKGELLYTGGKITVITGEKIKGKGSVKSDAKSVIQPEPNKTYLGMRPALWLYYVVKKPKRKKGLRVWLREKVAEEPVYLSKVDVPLVVKGIDAMLYNTGYLDSYSDYEIKPSKNGKTASINFRIFLKKPYTIDEVAFPVDSSALSQIIAETADKTLLKKGDKYSLETLRKERARIDDYMKERGYYYFNPDFILFGMDTVNETRTVKLYTTVKKTTPAKARIIYRIGEINVHPGFKKGDTTRFETQLIRRINYFKESNYIKPRVVVRSVFFRRDSIYDKRRHQMTLGRLNGLGVFKFINVDITDKDTTVPGFLAVNILLTPLPKKSLSLEVQLATKSNNFIGPGINVSFRNRNAFKGAELLIHNIRAYFEAQYSGEYKGQFTYEINPKVELDIPGFIPRFKVRNRGNGNRFLPRTKISLEYSYLSRVGFFDMNSFKLGIGYKWKRNLMIDHDLTLLNVNYFNVYRKTDKFNELITDNILLRRRFESQFIAGIAYSFYYNEQVKPKKNQFYFNGNIETAGNVLAGISQGINKRPVNSANPSQVLGVNFSQFLRMDIDVRDYVHTSKNTMLAFRLIAGWGFPYGNSQALPYSRQFFAGGAYSVRGFTANSLGPGAYSPPDSVRNVFYLQQGGEIKLEANAEFRFPIFGFLKGAVFVDAGNTWLNRANKDAPGGEFKVKNVWKEIALSTGAGVRVDLNFFVFRLDVGIPLRKPSLPEGDRWIINDLKFKNVVFNLAFGYPF